MFETEKYLINSNLVQIFSLSVLSPIVNLIKALLPLNMESKDEEKSQNAQKKENSEDEFVKNIFNCIKSTPVKRKLKRNPKQGMCMDENNVNEDYLNIVAIPDEDIVDSFILSYDEKNIVQIFDDIDIDTFILDFEMK